ncbi:MAG: universal stress protein [Methanotrichaceae archaeon]|nr:universal stress protein [Methanotrichaceae archaeon]
MIATDGSEHSRQATIIGVELARLLHAEILAIYVVDMHRLAQLPGYAGMPGTKQSLMELMLKEGERATEVVEEIAKEKGIPCQKLIARGDPSQELLKLSQGFDLVVLGSIGKTGLEKFLLGSVAEKIVRYSKIPVLLVP